eukprot:5047070-Prorocentrum_lima.AAC.1
MIGTDSSSMMHHALLWTAVGPDFWPTWYTQSWIQLKGRSQSSSRGPSPSEARARLLGCNNPTSV